jgi:UDP-2-acetamido-3-amino-2,3-dideoxy-glucuronate N-acetyltransferase
MTKILLLGLGRWGANHLRVLSSLPVELFVCDLQPKALEAARKLGLAEDHVSEHYQDFAACVDAAVVVTPAQSHFALCQEFLEADKDVFVEKPITLVSSEARALAKLAERRQRILQVGHIFRFDTATQWLKQALAEGRFGRLQLLRSNFSGFKRPRADSGVTFADAIHFVDLFNYLLDSSPRRVAAFMRDFLRRGPGFDDASLLSLEYETAGGPVWGVVETNYFLPGKYRELTVTGSELSAFCDFNVAQYKIKTFANRHLREGGQVKAVEGALSQIECAPVEPLLAQLQAFLRSLQTRQLPSADGWAGYHSVRVLEAALDSARSGRIVELEPV